MFSFVLCATIDHIFQKQYLANICVHQGYYKVHLFLHRIHFKNIIWIVLSMKRTKAATASEPAS